MTLTINELYKGVWETNGGKRLFEHKTIRKGEWKFFFRLSRRLDGIHYEIEGYKIDICISPLGMAIDGAGSGRFGKKISLLMQDGTRIEGTGYSYSKGMKDYKLSYEQASW